MPNSHQRNNASSTLALSSAEWANLTPNEKKNFKRWRKNVRLGRATGPRNRSRSPSQWGSQSGARQYRERSPVRQGEAPQEAESGSQGVAWPQGQRSMGNVRQITPERDETLRRHPYGTEPPNGHQVLRGLAQVRDLWQENGWSPRRDNESQRPQNTPAAVGPRGGGWNDYPAYTTAGAASGYEGGENMRSSIDRWREANAVQASGGGWDRPYIVVPGNEVPPPRMEAPPTRNEARPVKVYNLDDEVDWDDDEDEPAMPAVVASVTQQAAPQQQPRVAYYNPPKFDRDPGQSMYPPPIRKNWKRDYRVRGDKAQSPRPQLHRGQGGGYDRWEGHASNSGGRRSSVSGRSGAGSQAGENNLTRVDMAKTRDIPPTVYDLRKYDAEITALHESLPPHKRYISGNGKVRPGDYGSTPELDLGLCYGTYKTRSLCELGVACAWRHHPLTSFEREWIIANGHLEFVQEAKKMWQIPERPGPGASMHGR
jgi:hypothetical protein